MIENFNQALFGLIQIRMRKSHDERVYRPFHRVTFGESFRINLQKKLKINSSNTSNNLACSRTV